MIFDEVMYMEVRIFREFQNRYKMKASVAYRLFENHDIWGYIESCNPVLHMNEDEVVFNDVMKIKDHMSFETMEFCADLILTDAIEDFARETGQSKAEIRKAFMTSEAYDSLYDFQTGLWEEGPAYFIDFYKRLEKSRTHEASFTHK